MLQIQNFNPRSHEGSDGRNVLLPPAILYFNPRSHEGSDTDRNCKSIITKISIHAPTKGATCDSSSSSSVTTDFNPRSHEGSDHSERQTRQELKNFNPRSYEGSDCKDGSSVLICAYFNPRSYEGSDEDVLQFGTMESISIHAPTKGATMSSFCFSMVSLISIHAPTKGATALRNVCERG